ncbi:MAG: chromosome segregation SMC family protein, partial [Gemmatimonadales bacterium]
MKLTRLELSGFKSFADTVELVLEDGITAIVGPNGCGKSNISDAVRWVLGEQRPRVLRGTRMDELIFQGSVHRRAINVVDVSMYFDNSESVLDVPYSEVVVTRRLSRNGQSDYLLNQSPVRLRDLQDLLRGTGLGANAGVVIEARMIDRLLSDRPEERRSLFEEAAGIGIYRDRRATTERRLERTAEDLQRLEDLISEVQTQVRSLARQRGKTERYDRFRKERFDAFMTLIQRDLESFDLRKRELDRRREELDRKIPTADETLSRREREREAKIQARAGAMARHADLERRASDARLELERLEGDLKLLTERMEHASERRSRATEERAHAEARAAQALRELDAAQAELAQAAAARESVQMELDLKASDEGAVKERYREQRERVRDLEAKLQRHAEEHRSLAGERAAIERELEQLTIRLASQEQAREEARRELESSEAALAAARQRLSQAGADEKAQAVELERTREAVAAAREAESQARHDHRALQETMAQRRAREEALRQLERQRDGLAPAARRLLEERHSLGGEGILGPLSDYLDLPPDQAATAERLLADWLHAVLVGDMDTVEVVRRWHQAAKPGPLALLPVDPGPRQRPKARHLPISVAATDPAQPW